MVTLHDARDILRDYYAVHTAARADFDRMERWIAHEREYRIATFSMFAFWFVHHQSMISLHHEAEQRVFFPHLQTLRPDAEFASAMQAQDGKLAALQGQIVSCLQFGDNVVLDEPLSEYIVCARKHLDEEETLYVPRVLECYTRHAFHELERRFRKTLSWQEASAFLPWMLTGLPHTEQSQVIRRLPWPVRTLYDRVWEPAYHRRYRPFLSILTSGRERGSAAK